MYNEFSFSKAKAKMKKIRVAKKMNYFFQNIFYVVKKPLPLSFYKLDS